MRTRRLARWLAGSGVFALVWLLGHEEGETAPRNEHLHEFCRGAPDLCVFVCEDRYLGCSGMSSAFSCESRRGRLIVVEGAATGGGRSYHDHDYALCWHAPSSQDISLPDPEEEWVPRWPGSETEAMCHGCQGINEQCIDYVHSGEVACVDSCKDMVRRSCRFYASKEGAPRDRRGRFMEHRSSRCRKILRMDRDLAETDTETDPRTRKLLMVEVRQCRNTLIEQCVEEFAPDDPDAQTDRGGQWSFGVKEFFGRETRDNTTMRWGGSRGYVNACREAANIVTMSCAEKATECYAQADPKNHCMEQRR